MAVDYIKKIDAMGGMLRAIETGYVQNEISRQPTPIRSRSKLGTRSSSALKSIQIDAEGSIPVLRFDEKMERDQIAKGCSPFGQSEIGTLKNRSTYSKKRLAVRKPFAERILAAVENHVTVGEISDRLRKAGATTVSQLRSDGTLARCSALIRC